MKHTNTHNTTALSYNMGLLFIGMGFLGVVYIVMNKAYSEIADVRDNGTITEISNATRQQAALDATSWFDQIVNNIPFFIVVILSLSLLGWAIFIRQGYS